MRKRNPGIAGMALLLAAAVASSSLGAGGMAEAARTADTVQTVGTADAVQTADEVTQYEGYELVWHDEFDGAYLDDTKWRIGKEPENGSHRYNTAVTADGKLENENIFLENGVLQLKATPLEAPVTVGNKTYLGDSGMVETKTKASWRYGRFDIRAKLPVAKGMWPAIWMMPDVETYGWPKDGEIDIMELISQQPNVCYGTIHCGISGTDKYYHPTATYRLPEGTFYDDFHLFSMEWEPGVIRMYMDDILYATFTDWESWVVERGTAEPQIPIDFPHPFDALFYLKLNLATGKTGGWCEAVDETTDWENAVMSVDYVRVYKAVDKVYDYSREAFQSSVNRQGPVWYAQKQGTDAGMWENMQHYEEGWAEDGISITNNSVTCQEKDGAAAFVAPEDGYVQIRLKQEAVSADAFRLNVTKGKYHAADASFSASEETLASWESVPENGQYRTVYAGEGIVIPVSADDVIRLEVHANGNTVQNIEPVITYKKEVTLSYDAGGGKGTLPEVIRTGAGAEVIVPRCGLTKEGCVFDGWLCGNKRYQPGDFLILEQDERLTAVWRQTTAETEKKETEKKETESSVGGTQNQNHVQKPGKPKLTAKRTGNKVKLIWKKVKNADGYEISMKNGSGRYQVIARKGKAAKSYKKTVKSKKIVRFRVRAYRNSDKGKVYGKYSAVKKIKPKKKK